MDCGGSKPLAFRFSTFRRDVRALFPAASCDAELATARHHTHRPREHRPPRHRRLCATSRRNAVIGARNRRRPGSGGAAGATQAGVAEVITSDVDRLARLDLIQHAAAQILAGEVKLDSWDALERFGICYRAPHYVTDADQKVDCSCSNEVLEHVPPDQLVRLLAWTARGDHRNNDAFGRLQRPLCPFGRQPLPVQFPEIR